MKLINPSFEIFEQGPGLEGIYEAIERAGRTCYKSKRPEGQTAKDFVDRMIKSGHNSMLEHGTVYLKVPKDTTYRDGAFILNEPAAYTRNLYYKTHSHWTGNYRYITTNYRYIVENKLEHWLQFLCEPTEFHEKRVTVKFTTSNGIMREFTRHRSHSFAVESTRYCNYSKERFNNEVIFIQPYWYKNENLTKYNKIISGKNWLSAEIPDEVNRAGIFNEYLENAEETYLELISLGAKPQEAREVLPLATKCDMVMTGFTSDWNYFFDLRARGTTGAPHPDAKALAEPLMHEFEKRQLI